MKSPRRFPIRLILGSVLGLLAGALAAAESAPKPTRVIFETALGRITLEVDLAAAPVTSANFLKYVDGKFYDGGVINRAVRPDNTTRDDVEIQVIQLQSDAARKDALFAPMPLERTTPTGLRHGNGVISMARGGPTRRHPPFLVQSFGPGDASGRATALAAGSGDPSLQVSRRTLPAQTNSLSYHETPFRS